jgi:hypothetical protein
VGRNADVPLDETAPLSQIFNLKPNEILFYFKEDAESVSARKVATANKPKEENTVSGIGFHLFLLTA